MVALSAVPQLRDRLQVLPQEMPGGSEVIDPRRLSMRKRRSLARRMLAASE